MEELKPFREQIDELDRKIMALLGERFDVVRQVASIKSEHGIPTYIPARVEEVKSHCEELARQHNVDPVIIRVVYTILINHACDLEERLIAEKQAS